VQKQCKEVQEEMSSKKEKDKASLDLSIAGPNWMSFVMGWGTYIQRLFPDFFPAPH